ncbi:MAG TPA: phosphoribosylamine--glycine ligase [Thermoplasmata archaeon]|jgi:phosphoribosylamine--glycine ligase|nr:phosphoribosylamine--glycine ligase [Thermoplasmata archaeon]
MRFLVVGGGAREHAIGIALQRAGSELFVASSNANPGLERLASRSARLDPTDAKRVTSFASEVRAEAAVIGPEAPLAAGVADALRAAGVPTVGPDRAAAQIESSKLFCRELLQRHGVEGQPHFAAPAELEEVDRAVAEFTGPFVVKPSGLTAGKGVWVQGADFTDPKEGAAYAKSILVQGQRVLLEEKLEGEEFSQMAFVTDSGVYPMPAVQDFKRALAGDKGGNTGGMGSYSQRDHLLPFLPAADRDRSIATIEKAAAALREEGLPFRGILYGGFMLTAAGPRLLEFNARFGDPEGINALALYEPGDFEQLMFGVASGRVDPNVIRFRLRATVVKYVVPPGYGDRPKPGGLVRVDAGAIEEAGVHLVYGSVDAVAPGTVRLSSSRGLALVGEASAIHEAGSRVESALAFVKGDYYVRHDIGTKEDLARRWEHMRKLLAPNAKPSPIPLSVAPPEAPPSSAGTPDQVIG